MFAVQSLKSEARREACRNRKTIRALRGAQPMADSTEDMHAGDGTMGWRTFDIPLSHRMTIEKGNKSPFMSGTSMSEAALGLVARRRKGCCQKIDNVNWGSRPIM